MSRHPPPVCMMHDLFRALWQLKKQEERDLLFRDVEQLKQLQRLKMFGRFVPHHTLQCRYVRLCVMLDRGMFFMMA